MTTKKTCKYFSTICKLLFIFSKKIFFHVLQHLEVNRNISKISFTGLNNLKIAQSREPQNWVGLYPSVTGELKNGEIETREYKIRVDLTDDYSGRDYTDLLVEMAKAEKGLNTSYIKNAPPNRIELHMIKNKVVDDDLFKDYTYSTFKLNGEDLCAFGFPIFCAISE